MQSACPFRANKRLTHRSNHTECGKEFASLHAAALRRGDKLLLTSNQHIGTGWL
jgi:hypothetical protein